MNHKEVIEYIGNHPAFGVILDDALLTSIEGEWQEHIPKFPEIYCCIVDCTRVDLNILEAGLKFALSYTSGQPKSEFISHLQDKEGVGTVFELAILGALVLKFGEDKVKPFPDLGRGQRADVILRMGEREIYFECSVLNFSDADKDGIQRALSSDGTSASWLPGTGEGRIIQKIKGKFTRYKEGAPNVLLLSQYSCLPFDLYGLKVLREYLEVNGGTAPVSFYSGVFYFGQFKNHTWIPNQSCASESVISPEEWQLLSDTFEQMRP